MLRLRTIIRRSGAVAAEHREFQFHHLGLAVTPAQQWKFTTAFFRLRSSEGFAKLDSRIFAKVLAAHTEDDVADVEHAVRR